MKLVYQYMAIFLNLSPKSSSSTTSRELRQQFAAVVDEDDYGKFRLERVKHRGLDIPWTLSRKGFYELLNSQ